MKRITQVVHNERGGGLLMALLVIVALAAVAASIMSAVSSDRRITSYNMTRAQALNYAEAGVAEAMERIRNGDVPDNRKPTMVSQIFLTPMGTCPAVGTDTVAMATAQPAGNWIPYSSDTKGPNVLTVQYMTNSARTGIYYYDATKTPAIQGKTGDPVFLIHSPAQLGVAHRQVDAAVTMVTISPNLKAAYVGGDDVKMHGSEGIIGYDYSVDTPYGTGYLGARDNTWETGTNNRPGIWSRKKVDINSPAKAVGTPSATLQNQTGMYAGPWEVLNMSQSSFWDWVGPPLARPKGNGIMPSGVTYLGKPGAKPQKGKDKFRLKGGSGEGFLYVNGDLEISNDFTFRGLIYVEGSLKMSGTGWILGGVVVADNSSSKGSHKNVLTILKSNGAVQQFIQKHRSPFVAINWRES
jgi:Tfp pilus assembly protein PilX